MPVVALYSLKRIVTIYLRKWFFPMDEASIMNIQMWGNGYDCCLSKSNFSRWKCGRWGAGAAAQTTHNFLYNSNGSLTDLIDGTKDMGIHYDYTFC